MTRNFPPLFLALSVAAVLSTAAAASETGKSIEISGPVSADVIRIIDGDTILVAARPWPQQIVEVYVRLRGIDAPELKSSCSAIRDAGKRAQEELNRLTGGHGRIHLLRITGDKYFGRVLADVVLDDGRNPAQELLSGGYVTDYAVRKQTAQSCAFWK